jgi:hypothetical protein
VEGERRRAATRGLGLLAQRRRPKRARGIRCGFMGMNAESTEETKPMIDRIRQCVAIEDYRFTIHGFERCVERDISPEEVMQAIFAGEIIEDYPEDKYGHSCLIYGITEAGKILHVQCSFQPVWIITAYEPALSPMEWDKGFKRRRRNS